MEIAQYIQEGKAVLGIEFGSTRIKAVLIGEQGEPLASGSHNWETVSYTHLTLPTIPDV